MKLTKKSKNILFPAIILIGLSFLTFVFFKISPSFSINEKKTFISSFVKYFGFIVFFWIPIRKFISTKDNASLLNQSENDKKNFSASYQELFDETQAHLWQLKKYKMWTIGSLVFGWIIVFSIKLLGFPLAQNPYLPCALFCLLLLIGTKDLEKELALDKKIIENTLKGLKLEYNLKNSIFFRETAKSYEGAQLIGYIFVRITPTLMLIFSALNSGLDTLLENYIPKVFVQITIGSFIGIAAVFLGWLIRSRYKILQNSTSQNA